MTTAPNITATDLYQAGEADAQDEHAAGVTIEQLLVRAADTTTFHPVTEYAAGYASATLRLQRQQHEAAIAWTARSRADQ